MTHNELVIHTRKVAQAVKAWTCFCGRQKVKSLPLCRKCYHQLPDDLKDALNSSLNSLSEPFEAGLLQAYDDAKEWLGAANERKVDA